MDAKAVTDQRGMYEAMNVEIDYLIETTERLRKRFEGSGEFEIGIVLLCALELFKKEKSAKANSNNFENKLEEIKKLIENIDLTKCEPTPWSTTATNYVDCTGEVTGYTHLVNGNGERFLSTDRESDFEVEVDGWFHLGDFYIAAQSVNAIAEIKKILGVKERENEQ